MSKKNVSTTPSAIFFVKAKPNASLPGVSAWDGNCLTVRLKSVPEKGRANQELLRLLSLVLSCRLSSLSILQGETSGLKKIYVEGLSLTQIEEIFSKFFKDLKTVKRKKNP